MRLNSELALEISPDGRRPVVAIDRLEKRFGPVEALKAVSLTVLQGEIFGLLGSNGAGKTTLIKTLVGALRPAAGTAKVLDLDPIREGQTLRRRIGYMPQMPALYEDLSPRENLRFFGWPHGPPELERRIDEVLDFIDLRSRQRDPVYQFSGGMKQRVSLACALIHRPDVLFSTSRPRELIPGCAKPSGITFAPWRGPGQRCSSAPTRWTKCCTAIASPSCTMADFSFATLPEGCGVWGARRSESGAEASSKQPRSTITPNNCQRCSKNTISTRKSVESKSRTTRWRELCCVW